MAGAMTSVRILLLIVPVANAMHQSPGVVGDLKQLKEALSTPQSSSQASNITAQAPMLQNKLTSLFDHLKNATATATETKKENVVSKADDIIAKAEQKAKEIVAKAKEEASVQAPKAVEAPKEAVKVDAKPVEVAKSAAGFACECAPGAACPEVCTMGVKEPTVGALKKESNASASPASNASALKTDTKVVNASPAAVAVTPPKDSLYTPILESNWTGFANQVSGFANVHQALFNHSDGEVRGFAASKDLKVNDTVLTVPADLTLSAVNPALKRFFGDVNIKDPDSTWRLVSFLAVEKQLGSQSPWAMFFEHLPSADDFKSNHPLWAEKALLEKFVPIPLLHEVHDYQKMFKEDFRVWKLFVKAINRKPELFYGQKGLPHHVQLLRNAVPSVTKDDLFWAFTVVLTRGFESAHGTTLAPVADDFNTDLATHQNAQWHAKPGGSIEIKATHEVKSGSEILINYANKPIDNAKFAAVWGFYLANNNVGVSRLAFEDCQALEDRLVWKAKKTALRTGRAIPTKKLGSCVVPASEKQPGTYCTLLSLAKEHCPYVKDFQ